MVTLKPITRSNRDELEAMKDSPLQETFVTTVADSLEEAAEEPDGRAIAWGVYTDETPVGFVMISDDVGGPGYISQYLWKLFIDERHQGRGFGTATLDLIVEAFPLSAGGNGRYGRAPARGRAAPSLSTSDTASFERAKLCASEQREGTPAAGSDLAADEPLRGSGNSTMEWLGLRSPWLRLTTTVGIALRHSREAVVLGTPRLRRSCRCSAAPCPRSSRRAGTTAP